MQKRHPRQHVSGIAIAGFNALYDNYSHCVSESMASISISIDAMRRRGAEHLTIVTGKHRSFGRQHLQILLQGERDIDVVELDRDEFITCDRLLYCDNLGPLTPPRVVLEKAAYIEKVIANCGLQDAVPHRFIYLARTDTKARQVLNEAELIARMAGLGFEIFVATTVSVAEQIRTFREAKFVVGAHGAGLTNVAFQQSGTVLLELIQSSYLNTGLTRLSQIANVRYYSEMFFPEGEPNPDQSWSVDVDRVERVVRRLLEIC
jgi:capsular polysaccharide biosynthesis protein